MYHVVKVTNRIFDHGQGKFWYTGQAWGVFDTNDNLNYRTNQHGNRNYDVYDYKYVAQHQADYLNKEI